ncbi:hypothetical protein ACFWA9_04720 [Kitasatospora sp. NPDC059973]|uniref:hypothetical protein n=1 Tax=Kitasatospora sp. NPDC059973 TaxID=3347020 RepID=UPI00367E2311
MPRRRQLRHLAPLVHPRDRWLLSGSQPPHHFHPVPLKDGDTTSTHQDVILIAGDPADPKARRIRLADAYASATYHLDEDDDPDAFAITFADTRG